MTTTQASDQSRAVRERALEVIRGFTSELRQVEPDTVQETSNFREDLELDSLDLAALAMALEEEFDLMLDDESVVTIHTVGDGLDLIVAMVGSGATGAAQPKEG
ncbi:MAG: phosphopantetheine-binding protein [Actinomycetota bacterium]|nr:phosphopantetheine-binding protein [Actinomycetota bacterium]